MSVRLGVLVLAVSGCAAAPLRDENAARIDAAMVPEQGELPAPIALGQDAPPLAAPWPAPARPIGRAGFRFGRGRVISHTYPGHIPDVTVGEVNCGGTTIGPITSSFTGPHVVTR